MCQDTKHINLAHFDFDSKYGKKALDEMLLKFRSKGSSSSFPELSESLEMDTVQRVDECPELRDLLAPMPPGADSNTWSFATLLNTRPDGANALLFSEAALAWLYLVGINVCAGDNVTVAKFLNRILGLQFEQQNHLFQVYSVFPQKSLTQLIIFML